MVRRRLLLDMAKESAAFLAQATRAPGRAAFLEGSLLPAGLKTAPVGNLGWRGSLVQPRTRSRVSVTAASPWSSIYPACCP